MTWVTWRQQRPEALIAALLFALVLALLVPTGLHIASVYDADGVAGCLGHPTGACGETISAFSGRWDTLVNLVAWFNLLPALIGVLFAAPFVLEFEHGTFRLAWTQSVTRDRWLTVRLALIAAATAAVALLLTVAMTWWRHPLDSAGSRLQDGFNFEGATPVAYALFATALVIALGVVLRRTAAAIGLSLVAFVALRVAVEGWVRPHYLAAIHARWTGTHGPDLRGAWILSQLNGLRVGEAHGIPPAVAASCVSGFKRLDSQCLARHGIVQYASAVYQPASRFWLFQGVEAGIFLALALALGAFAVVWIRRRI